MKEKELIRCKDCKHFEHSEIGRSLCRRLKITIKQTDDGFCNFAEIKEAELTYKEAAEIIRKSVIASCGYTCDDVKKAKSMAIKALECIDKNEKSNQIEIKPPIYKVDGRHIYANGIKVGHLYENCVELF